MAIKVQKYLMNLGKSVAYTAADVAKENFEFINEFSETNKDVFNNTYSMIKDYRTTFKKVTKALTNNKVTDAARVGFDSIMYSIKTGDFYAKNRENEVYAKYGGMDMGDGDFDIDSEDFDWGDDDITSGDKAISIAVKKNSKISTAMTIEAMAETTKASIDAGKENTQLLFMQQEKLMNKLNGDVNRLSTFLVSNAERTDKIQQKQNENLNKFMTSVDNNLNKITKQFDELLEMQRNIYQGKDKKEEGSSKAITLNQVLDGGLNLKTYGKSIMKNAKNFINEKSGGSLDMFFGNMLGDDSNVLATFAANPLRLLMSTGLNSLIGGNAKKSAKSLDSTLKSSVAELIRKANRGKNSDNPVTSFLGNIFGVNEQKYKSSIDSSKYNRGPIPFDGETKRAIIEVIPFYLRKMTAAMTDGMEHIFDFKAGKWTNKRSLEKAYGEAKAKDQIDAVNLILKTLDPNGIAAKTMNENSYKTYMDGIRSLASSMLSYGGFDAGLYDNLDSRGKEAFKALAEIMNPSNGKGGSKRFAGSTKDNIFGTGKSSGIRYVKQSEFNNTIMNIKASKSATYEDLERNGGALVYVAGENGFKAISPDKIMDSKFSKYGKTKEREDYENYAANQKVINNSAMALTLRNAIDEHGHTIFQYLRAIALSNSANTTLLKSISFKGVGNKNKGKKSNNGKRPNNRLYDKAMKDLGIESLTADEYKLLVGNTDDFNLKGGFRNKKKKAEEADAENKKNIDENFIKQAEKLDSKYGTHIADQIRNGNIGGYSFHSEDGSTGFNQALAYNDIIGQRDAKKSEEEEEKQLKTKLGSKFDKKKSMSENVKNASTTTEKINIMKYYANQALDKPRNKMASEMQKLEFKIDEFLFGKAGDPEAEKKGLITTISEKFTKGIEDISDKMDKFWEESPVGKWLNKMKVKVFGDDQNEGILSPIKNGYTSYFENLHKELEEERKRRKQAEAAKNGGENTESTSSSSSSGSNYSTYEERISSLNQKISTDQSNELKDKLRQRKAERDNSRYTFSQHNFFYRDHNTRLRNRLGEEQRKLSIMNGHIADIPRAIAEIKDYISKNYVKSIDDNIKDILGKYNLSYTGNYNQLKKDIISGNPRYFISTKYSEAEISDKENFLNMIKKKNNIKNMAVGGVNRTGHNITSALSAGEYLNGKQITATGIYNIPPGGSVVNPAPPSVRAIQARNERNLIRNIRSNANANEGVTPTQEYNKLSEENAKKFTEWGRTAGASTLGAGAGLLLGGPVLGGLMGAVSSFAQRSGEFADAIFGKIQETDENGKVTKRDDSGLISDKLRKDVPKSLLPAGIGGLISMAATPLGPVPGILVGSALHFAKNSETAQNALFGENGLFSEDVKKNLEEHKARLGIGAAVGALIAPGPLGIVGGALVGTAVSYATTTQKFKEFVFGKEDANGDKYGGLVGAIKSSLKPAKDLGKKLIGSIQDLIFGKEKNGKREGGIFGAIKKDVIKPLSDGVPALLKAASNGIEDLGKWFKGKIHDIRTNNTVQNVTHGIGTALKRTIGASVIGATIGGKQLVKGAWGLATSPIRSFGAWGNAQRVKQIMEGRADDMTAAQQINTIAEYGPNGNRTNYKFRPMLELMTQKNADGKGFTLSTENMRALSAAISYDQDKTSFNQKAEEKLTKETRDALAAQSDKKLAMKIVKKLTHGEIDAAKSIAIKSGLDEATVQKLLNIIDGYASNKAAIMQQRADLEANGGKGTYEKVINSLSGTDDATKKKLAAIFANKDDRAKLGKMLDREISHRGSETIEGTNEDNLARKRAKYTFGPITESIATVVEVLTGKKPEVDKDGVVHNPVIHEDRKSEQELEANRIKIDESILPPDEYVRSHSDGVKGSKIGAVGSYIKGKSRLVGNLKNRGTNILADLMAGNIFGVGKELLGYNKDVLHDGIIMPLSIAKDGVKGIGKGIKGAAKWTGKSIKNGIKEGWANHKKKKAREGNKEEFEKAWAKLEEENARGEFTYSEYREQQKECEDFYKCKYVYKGDKRIVVDMTAKGRLAALGNGISDKVTNSALAKNIKNAKAAHDDKRNKKISSEKIEFERQYSQLQKGRKNGLITEPEYLDSLKSLKRKYHCEIEMDENGNEKIVHSGVSTKIKVGARKLKSGAQGLLKKFTESKVGSKIMDATGLGQEGFWSVALHKFDKLIDNTDETSEGKIKKRIKGIGKVLLKTAGTLWLMGMFKDKLEPVLKSRIAPLIIGKAHKEQDGTTTYTGGLISPLANGIAGVWSKHIKPFFKDIWSNVKDWFTSSGAYSAEGKGLKGLLGGMGGIVKANAGYVKAGLVEVVPQIAEWIGANLITGGWQIIKGLWSGLWSSVSGGFASNANANDGLTPMGSSSGGSGSSSATGSTTKLTTSTSDMTISDGFGGKITIPGSSASYTMNGLKTNFDFGSGGSMNLGNTVKDINSVAASVGIRQGARSEAAALTIGSDGTTSNKKLKNQLNNSGTIKDYDKLAPELMESTSKEAADAAEQEAEKTIREFNEAALKNGTEQISDAQAKVIKNEARMEAEKAATKSFGKEARSLGASSVGKQSKLAKFGEKIVSKLPGVKKLKRIKKLSKIVSAPAKLYSKVTTKAMNAFASTKVGGAVNKLGNNITKINTKAVEVAGKAKDKVVGALANTKVGKVASKVKGVAESLIESIKGGMTKIKDFVKKLFKSKKIAKALGDAGADKLDELAEKAASGILTSVEKSGKEIGEKAAKEGAEGAIKNGLNATGIGVVVTIALAIGDFLSGMKHCNNMLGTANENPTWLERFMGGFINILQDIPVVGIAFGILLGFEGLRKVVVGALLTVFNAIFKKLGFTGFEKILEDREEAEKELKEFNEANGTNIDSMEEFNNLKGTDTSAIGNAMSSIVGNDSQTKKGIDSMTTVEADKGAPAKIKKKLTTLFSSIWQQFGSSMLFIKTDADGNDLSDDEKENQSRMTFTACAAKIVDQLTSIANNVNSQDEDCAKDIKGEVSDRIGAWDSRHTLKNEYKKGKDKAIELFGCSEDVADWKRVRMMAGIAWVLVKIFQPAIDKGYVSQGTIASVVLSCMTSSYFSNSKSENEASVVNLATTATSNLEQYAASTADTTGTTGSTTSTTIAQNANANDKLSSFTTTSGNSGDLWINAFASLFESVNTGLASQFASVADELANMESANADINSRINELSVLPTDKDFWEIKADSSNKLAVGIFKFREMINRMLKVPFSIISQDNAVSSSEIINSDSTSSSSTTTTAKSIKSKIASKIKSLKAKLSGKGKYGMGEGGDPNDPYHIYQRNYHDSYSVSGDNDHQSIADSGCGPAAAATIMNMYGMNGDIKSAAKYALNGKYKEVNGGTYPEYFSDYLGQNGISTHQGASVGEAVGNLAQGKPVILMGRNSNGGNVPFGKDYSHYVVARGIDKNGNIIVEDSEDKNGSTKYSLKDTLANTSIRITTGNGKFGRARGNMFGKFINNTSGVVSGSLAKILEAVNNTSASTSSTSNTGSSGSNGTVDSNLNTTAVNGTTVTIPDDIAQRPLSDAIYTNYSYYYSRWGSTSIQRKIADAWGTTYNKAKANNGVALVDGYYCIACAQTFGTTGDVLKVTLSNGKSFNAIMADAKSTEDSNITKYGHESNGKVNVIEWEIVGPDSSSSIPSSYYDLSEFSGATVKSITNGGTWSGLSGSGRGKGLLRRLGRSKFGRAEDDETTTDDTTTVEETTTTDDTTADTTTTDDTSTTTSDSSSSSSSSSGSTTSSLFSSITELGTKYLQKMFPGVYEALFSSSDSTDGSTDGTTTSSATYNGTSVIYAAAMVFEALYNADNTLRYDASGSTHHDLTCRDGTKLEHERPDCSGMMSALIHYMGYYTTRYSASTDYTDTYHGEGFGSAAGNTGTQNFIYDKEGNVSTDWELIKFSESGTAQAGDIRFRSGHTDMFIFYDSGNYPRGFNAGSGDCGSSQGDGMYNSYCLAKYYLDNNSTLPDSHSSDVGKGRGKLGSGTITDKECTYVLRYKGSSASGYGKGSSRNKKMTKSDYAKLNRKVPASNVMHTDSGSYPVRSTARGVSGLGRYSSTTVGRGSVNNSYRNTTTGYPNSNSMQSGSNYNNSSGYGTGGISNSDLSALITLLSNISENSDQMSSVIKLLATIATNTTRVSDNYSSGLSGLQNALNNNNNGTDIVDAIYKIASR